VRRTSLVCLVGAAVVLVSPAVATASAPGKSARNLDMSAARRQISSLVQQTYPGLASGNVACPASVARHRGDRFTCTVQVPGNFLVIDADETDAQGGISVDSSQAVIAKAQAEQFVAAHATLTAKVDCGPLPWLVLEAGQRFTCTASLADGTVQHVEVTVRDHDGNVAITGVS
jgi:hypothetical protein